MLPVTLVQLPPPRPPRDWRAYNAYQQAEGALFPQLAWDLLQCVPEPPYKGNGRPSLPLRDVLLYGLTQQFRHNGARRHKSDGNRLQEDGLTTQNPHCQAATRIFTDPNLIPTLQKVVTLAALPVAVLEDSATIDSTGLACARYGTYRETLYGPRRAHREWVKLHALMGLRSKVIIAARVTPGNVHDTTQLPALLKDAQPYFHLQRILADKAYSSKKNIYTITAMGATPYIPFRSGKNTPAGNTGAASYRGGIHAKAWRRSWHYFNLYRDEFNEMYRFRGNAETGNSAFKGVLNEHIRARKPAARVNEALCRVIAHNIRQLVRVMHEYGVPPDFGGLNGHSGKP